MEVCRLVPIWHVSWVASHAAPLEFECGILLIGEVVRGEVVAIGLHRPEDGAVQARGVDLSVDQERVSTNMRAACVGRPSGGQFPGRSENVNRWYTFAQMSAPGKISDVSMTVSSGRMILRGMGSS